MRSRALMACAVTVALLSGSFAFGSNAIQATVGASDDAVAYQINPAHNGYQSDPLLTPPLPHLWSRTDLGTYISYPLIADGMIFVTAAGSSYNSYPPKTLYALNPVTGATIWSQPLTGTYSWVTAAYDAGTVFVQNYDGLLWSFNAQTGQPGWSVKLPGQWSFTSPPTAYERILYTAGAGEAGTVYAVDEKNGTVLWTKPVANGDNSSPAVSSTGVYVSYSCANTYDFDPNTGKQLWTYVGSCEEGGGRTPVLNGNHLYVRDFVTTPPGYLFDAGTGSLLSRFSQSGPAPAFDGTTELFLNAGTLQAIGPTGSVLWSFAGDGSLDSAPIVVNSDVYVGSSSGNLYAVDASTGHQVWNVNVGSGIPAPDEQDAFPLTGLGAGEGVLVVPAGSVLTAYGFARNNRLLSTPQGSEAFTAVPGRSNRMTSTPIPAETPTSDSGRKGRGSLGSMARVLHVS